MFNEICIYEAKLTKLNEIEELMKEVAEFYLKQDKIILFIKIDNTCIFFILFQTSIYRFMYKKYSPLSS